jgi:hypothetical protein
MSKRMIVAVTMAVSLAMLPARAQAVKTVAGDPQVKDDLFAGTEKFEKNAVSVTEVTMDPESLGLVSGKDKAKAKGMKLNVVRTYIYDKPGQYDMADVDAFRAKLMAGDWHCSVHIRDIKMGSSTDVCKKTRTDDLVESAIMTVGPKQLTFIHTIKEKGAWDGRNYGAYSGSYSNGWSNESALGGWPLAMGPEMQAERAVADAQMQAQMAVIGPQMSAEMAAAMAQVGATHVDLDGLKVKLDGLKSMKMPDDAEMQRSLDNAKKALDAAHTGAETQP